MRPEDSDMKADFPCAGPLIPWSLLNREARAIVRRVLADWRGLLGDKNETEEAYHAFLAEHAGFFFRFVSIVPVISKLRLGSDYVVDLVLCSDNRSEGVHYTLVELESPHVPAYTKGGQPSSRLTGALQQIQDWQRWIDSNRGEAKRLFRSLFFERYNQPSFDYMVIIGKRKVDSDYLHLRNRLSQQMRVRIRSYDWFTSNDFPFQDVAAEAVRPTNRVPAALGHLLADPFAVAYSDPEWRSMVKRRDFGSSHFVSENARTLVETRHRNARYLELERLWSKLSKRSRKLETWFLERLLTACDRG